MDLLPDVMLWLHDRVPLTLLIDLLDEAGPRSAELLETETPDLSWLAGAAA